MVASESVMHHIKHATIISNTWGSLASGESVSIYTLRHPSGLEAQVSSFGATLVSLKVPTADGFLRDVVLGFDDLASYESNHIYLGSTVGRVAGRLTGSQYTDEGEIYQLTKNEGSNHLHGGGQSIERKLWDAEIDGDSLVLSCLDSAGTHGYPGNVKISVSYRLNDERGLEIKYRATSDAVTPLSLTNHAYFNLNGVENKSGLYQSVQILADEYVPAADDGALADVKEAVIKGGNDLRELSALDQHIDNISRQHGDCYMLNSYDAESKEPRLVAKLQSSDSSLTMETYTTEPCLQFYTGRYIDGGLVGRGDVTYEDYSGLCFECHGYSNQPNAREFPSIMLQPDGAYEQTTVYRFTE